jgi:hypothetical protein
LGPHVERGKTDLDVGRDVVERADVEADARGVRLLDALLHQLDVGPDREAGVDSFAIEKM